MTAPPSRIAEPSLRIWDVSQPLRAGIPVWPGDTAFEETRVATISADCPVNVSRLVLSTHTGTHADGPVHYDPDGRGVGEGDLEPYLGPAQLLTVTAAGGLVREADVLGRLVPGVRRVLLRAFDLFPADRWRSDFPAIDPALVDALAARGCILIGTDTPSLDPETSKTMLAHLAVARHGLAILEGLVFDDVADGLYELIALPLRLVHADASPVRALLRELPA
ncbi:MAG: arylformamidase [Sphingopyxis sp.]